MLFLDLPKPDWKSLPGGDDTVRWIAARNQKIALFAESIRVIGDTVDALISTGAEFNCSPAVLQSVPEAARYYLDLAGLADKTISRMKEERSEYGLRLSPSTMAVSLLRKKSPPPDQLEAFSNWINDHISRLYSPGGHSRDAAFGAVAMMVGARIQGQVQNIAGDDAVLILKALLVNAMRTRGVPVFVGAGKSKLHWTPFTPEVDLRRVKFLRFGDQLTCEFVPGGNRPDIKVLHGQLIVAQGEIKGRKDLSNLWESWMPQIAGHLKTWAFEAADAPRLFFGTIITEEMIEGITQGGTHHNGLKALHNNGQLTAAYNLSLIASGDSAAVAQFEQLVDELVKRTG